MVESALNLLPHHIIEQIFSRLPLRQILISRTLSKFFNQTLSSPTFLNLISSTIPPLRLIAIRPSPPHQHPPYLHVFDPDLNQWLKFPLHFLPFNTIPFPVASSQDGLVYFWVDSDSSNKSLVVCNPLTCHFRVLPPLGSAWSRHGTVLASSTSTSRLLVLTELAALYLSSSSSSSWLKFSSNLPSKPRSPILVSDSVFALCDVGSPWRSQWKLFFSTLPDLHNSRKWNRLERHEWGDVFDILKRPRLIHGGNRKILMVGGLKSSFSLNASCSTILILRLDLDTLEWDEAARMPPDMFTTFQLSTKFKVFGGGDRVCFSARRLRKLAMWDSAGGKGEWKWIHGVPGNADQLFRGFLFQPSLNTLP